MIITKDFTLENVLNHIREAELAYEQKHKYVYDEDIKIRMTSKAYLTVINNTEHYVALHLPMKTAINKIKNHPLEIIESEEEYIEIFTI